MNAITNPCTMYDVDIPCTECTGFLDAHDEGCPEDNGMTEAEYEAARQYLASRQN